MNVYFYFAIFFGALTAICSYLGAQHEGKKSNDELKNHIDSRANNGNQEIPSAQAIINDGANISISLKVKIRLVFSKNSTHYRLSEKPNFVNVDWMAITEFTEFTFNKAGRMTLYYQVSSNGVISATKAEVVNIFLPPKIEDVAIFGFDSASRQIGSGYSKFYILTEKENIVILNIEYPDWEKKSDIPSIDERFHITEWRYCFDKSLANTPWQKVSTISFKEDKENYLRYFFPIFPPKTPGNHKIVLQIKSLSGESNVFSKDYLGKYE